MRLCCPWTRQVARTCTSWLPPRVIYRFHGYSSSKEPHSEPHSLLELSPGISQVGSRNDVGWSTTEQM